MADHPRRLKRSGLTMPIVTERFINNAWHRGCDYINMDLGGLRSSPPQGRRPKPGQGEHPGGQQGWR